MTQTIKPVKIIDLNGNARYFLCIDTGKQIIQQEITEHEYNSLINIDDRYFRQSVLELKHKYNLMNQFLNPTISDDPFHDETIRENEEIENMRESWKEMERDDDRMEKPDREAEWNIMNDLS